MGLTSEGNNVGVGVGEDIGDNVGDDLGNNYGGIIDADDGGFGGERLWGRRWRMATTTTTMAGGSFNGGGVKVRRNNQIDYNKDDKGRLKDLGGVHSRVGGMLSCLSLGGGEEDGGRRGGSAPDDGAGVVGVGHLPKRSTPASNQGRLSSTDRRQEGSKGETLLSHIMVPPTDQPTIRHRVRKLEAKKYACGLIIIHGGEDR
jgi:hypothetical protein